VTMDNNMASIDGVLAWKAGDEWPEQYLPPKVESLNAPPAKLLGSLQCVAISEHLTAS
jgi:hypothetical protein